MTILTGKMSASEIILLQPEKRSEDGFKFHME